MVKRIQKLPKIAIPGKEPVVKQPPELTEADPRDSYLEITLSDTDFDSIGGECRGYLQSQKNIVCWNMC